jgi:hypothetical protein
MRHRSAMTGGAYVRDFVVASCCREARVIRLSINRLRSPSTAFDDRREAAVNFSANDGRSSDRSNIPRLRRAAADNGHLPATWRSVAAGALACI